MFYFMFTDWTNISGHLNGWRPVHNIVFTDTMFEIYDYFTSEKCEIPFKEESFEEDFPFQK